MMPHHRNMVRSQCRVLESFGGRIGEAMLTLRLSPAPGRSDALRRYLREVLAGIASRPGMTGGHLLQMQTLDIAPSTEQKICGGADAAADWVVLAGGYDANALGSLLSDELGVRTLADVGALQVTIAAVYRLRLSMTPADRIA